MSAPKNIEDTLDKIMDEIEEQSKIISLLEQSQKDDILGTYDEALEKANQKLLELGNRYNLLESEYIDEKERFYIMKDNV